MRTVAVLLHNNMNCIVSMSFSCQKHMAKCEFATVPCPQCQQSVRQSQIEEHTTVECTRRPVSCPDCLLCFVHEEREVMWTHLSICSHWKVISCIVNQLGLVSLQSVLVSHQLHEQQCPFASVKCQYCEMDLLRDQVSNTITTYVKTW